MKFKTPNKRQLKKDKKLLKKFKFDQVIDSPVDERDYTLERAILPQSNDASAQQPNSSQLIPDLPQEYESEELPILNQGSVGSCVAHALASALRAGEDANKFKHNNYSRGYIYGNRKSTDTQQEGMVIREALSQLHHCGDVYHNDFPYNLKYPSVKDLIAKRQDELAQLALPHATVAYYRCYTTQEIKQSIVINGCAIVSVTVYSDFARDLHPTQTHINNGRHCMIIVGWTKDNKWIVQNSWGRGWGYQGKLLMDFDYPTNEVWGMVVHDGEMREDVKESKWIRFCEAIKGICKIVKIWIVDIFSKKKK